MPCAPSQKGLVGLSAVVSARLPGGAERLLPAVASWGRNPGAFKRSFSLPFPSSVLSADPPMNDRQGHGHRAIPEGFMRRGAGQAPHPNAFLVLTALRHRRGEKGKPSLVSDAHELQHDEFCSYAHELRSVFFLIVCSRAAEIRFAPEFVWPKSPPLPHGGIYHWGISNSLCN
jgi:hypothetical protein